MEEIKNLQTKNSAPVAEKCLALEGTDHIRIPLLLAQIETSDIESPLISLAISELNEKHWSKLSAEQKKRLNAVIHKKEKHFEKQEQAAQEN